MKCPNCGSRTTVDIVEADGYCQDSRECTACGCQWTFKESNRVIICPGNQVLMEDK